MARKNRNEPKILLAWLGNADRRAAQSVSIKEIRSPKADVGPIARAALDEHYEQIWILDDRGGGDDYSKWLRQALDKSVVRVLPVHLSGPTALEEIYKNCEMILQQVDEELGSGLQKVFLISAGTPAMLAIWIILAPKYSAELVETSKEQGVVHVNLPFELRVKYPSPEEVAYRERCFASSETLGRFRSEFLYQCDAMKDVVESAIRIARTSLPVLILGETGTGKDMVAQLIHKESRGDKPYIAINCSAISPELLESELFGYGKGSFTGAKEEGHIGKLEAAKDGTVFLDEIGDMPLDQQAKLLRAVENMSVTRVGETQERSIQCRFIAATKHELMRDVVDGRFREDLFYRLAVADITVPPLRERGREEIALLVDAFLEEINKKDAGLEGFPKTLTSEARNVLLNYDWPGNVRELYYTMQRIAILTRSKEIQPGDVEARLHRLPKRDDNPLDMPLGEEFELETVLKKGPCDETDRLSTEEIGRTSRRLAAVVGEMGTRAGRKSAR